MSSLHTRMSWRRAKTSGWSAFDLKERGKQHGLEAQSNLEPYPPISGSIPLSRPQQKSSKDRNTVSEKPFSAVLKPSFPLLERNKSPTDKQVLASSSTSNWSTKFLNGNLIDKSVEKLKEIYPWADESLIKDIMAGLGNNVDEAVAMLGSMVSTNENPESRVSFSQNNEDLSNEEEDKQIKTNEQVVDKLSFFLNPTVPFGKDRQKNMGKEAEETKPKNEGLSLYYQKDTTIEDDSVGQGTDTAEFRFLLEEHFSQTEKVVNGDQLSSQEAVSHDKALVRLVPVEPEWEEDDVYLIYRKDALKMMRSASKHSKAANDAYLRGDHLSAQQFSLKARDEWAAAERLNAQAAKQILSTRNSRNDQWTLDLHGLHAAEAVQALQEHLQGIESQVLLNSSPCPDGVNLTSKDDFLGQESSNPTASENINKQQQSSRSRLATLQVITGIGNHSRGQAALPIAIRNFLMENGYRFNETRPGVIKVRPKFRTKS